MFLRNALLQLLSLFKLALFARIIIDYIRLFARSWRPNTFLLAIFEVVYTLAGDRVRVVTAFFDSRDDAMRALDRLAAIGVPRTDLHLTEGRPGFHDGLVLRKLSDQRQQAQTRRIAVNAIGAIVVQQKANC